MQAAETAESLFNRGVALGRQGKLDEAAACYEQALALKPDYAEALVNLGSIHRAQGLSDEAIARFRQAIVLKPDYPLAFYNLGNALRRQGRLDEAAAAYRQAIGQKPDYGEAHYNLGVALRDQGAIAAALQAFERAAALMPLYAPAFYELGVALHGQGRLDDAAPAFERALALEPGYAQAHYSLGATLQAQGEMAAASYRRALAVRPDYAAAHNNLGAALRDQGLLDEAVAAHRRAIALAPDDALAHFNLGAALQDQGELEAAAAAYLRALALKPDLAAAHYNLALQTSLNRGAPQAGAAAALLDRQAAVLGQSPPAERSLLLFAMARTLEADGAFDRAFAALAEANALHRASLSFEIAQAEARMTAIADRFSGALLKRSGGAGPASERPIFIVGMPRSGSSLVEQILSAHPQVHGAGEIMTLPALIAQSPGPAYPDWDEPTIRGAAHALGQAYLDAVPAGAPGQTRVTDKMLANFHHVGLIHLALPRARIIHCRRDPRDVCFSAFATRFGEGWEHSYDLDELGRYWRAYDRLMRHWTATLPIGRMLDVPYEAVVEDLEGWARALVAHCGLEWDDACLRFHASGRKVLTTSFAQVRRPVYGDSVGRWRRFAAHLDPLLDALGEPWDAAR